MQTTIIQIENEGSTLRLPCVVDCLEGFVLLWRKNGTILAVGDQVINKVSKTWMVRRK